MRKKLVVTNSKDHRQLYADLYYHENCHDLVLIFHGMSEHKERYQYFIDRLLDNNFAVLNCDERGHGESYLKEEEKGFFSEKDGWLLNLEDLHSLALLAQKEVNLPIIVFGHSMGSMVARCYLKRYGDEIKKVVLSGSPINNNALNIAKRFANNLIRIRGQYYRSKIMDNLCFGSYNAKINNPNTKFDWLSVNNENVNNYIKDNDCGFIFTASGYLDLFNIMGDCYSKDNWKITIKDMPICFFSGENDPCMAKVNNMDIMKKALNDVGYQNVSSYIFEGLRHEILQETCKDEVISKIINFMNQ